MLAGCSTDTGAEAAPSTRVACADEHELSLPDGRCVRPGISEEGCAEGFEHDGEYGCTPVFPTERCPLGLMAVPGDAACRSVMPCGAGTWGDIPVDVDTEFVDQSYAGADSDGSQSKPWQTIPAAYAAATAGAVIAVGAGSYSGDVAMNVKAARLWGVCPERTELVGDGSLLGTIEIQGLASGTEIHSVAVRGLTGVLVNGASDVLLDRLWVHGTSRRGVHLQRSLGTVIVDSLIEQTREFGIIDIGGEVTVERTVVRATAPAATQIWGRGINVMDCNPPEGCNPTARSTVTLRASVIEDNHEIGVHITGSDGLVEGSVVRATWPEAAASAAGFGIRVEMSCVPVGCDAAFASTATIRGSLVERNHDIGIVVMGSSATIESTTVRETIPRATDQAHGIGILLQYPIGTAQSFPEFAPRAVVRTSLIERNTDLGVYVSGAASFEMDSSVVRHTLPAADERRYGRGINAQRSCFEPPCDLGIGMLTTITGSLIEQNHEMGLYFNDIDAVVGSTVVRSTVADNGMFGDGISALTVDVPTHVALTNVRVEQSARAGVSSFGSSFSLTSTRIQCAAFDLTSDASGSNSASIEDRGDNLCGCPSADQPCRASAANLQPPEPLPPQ